MKKALCDSPFSPFLHMSLKSDTRYKGRHCHIIWDSMKVTEDAWGEMTAGDTTGDANPFRYVGSFGVRWQDRTMGMYHMGARHYKPQTGRFTQRDPIMGYVIYPQTMNRYVYCNNNSVNFVDPSGKSLLKLGACAVAIISVVSDIAVWGEYKKLAERAGEIRSELDKCPDEKKQEELQAELKIMSQKAANAAGWGMGGGVIGLAALAACIALP